MPYKFISYLFLSGFIALFAWACINPIENFVQIDSTSFMTIEADISDDAKLCKIKISSSANKISSALSLPVSKAMVYITDQNNVKTTFLETANTGIYLPPSGFVGKVGSTYQLYIKTLNGKEYQSIPEKMNSVPEIDNVIARFEVFDQYSKVDYRRAGFSVYLDFKDNPSEGDFYMWNWTHYEPITICATCDGGGTYNFRTNECVIPRNPTDEILNYRCNGNCWDISRNTELNVFSDVLTNGQRVVGRQVARAPFNGYTPYYFRLEQRAITKNAHIFYQSLISAVQSSGSLFDVPAETRFSINLKSISNPSERILGLLNVFSVRKKIFYIDRKNNIPEGESAIVPTLLGEIFTCPPANPTCQDLVPCFESKTRTKITPEEWKY
jgi:hypothetical protein